jgi:light-regulated signal transduction histidine kinase (bacteriophytochrome)
MKEVSCQHVLEQILASLQQTIRESRATITHDALPTVVGEELQLTQLFQNLLTNALKYRGKDPPHIHIGVEQRDSEWLFRVRDNGIGIAPQHQQRIFLLFQRIHERGKYPGTGIGLAICSKVIETHGGKIWVESEEGKGATFFFTLPRTRSMRASPS